jgi:hypothetical protein
VAGSDGAAPAVWAMGRAGPRPAAGVDGGRAGRRRDCGRQGSGRRGGDVAATARWTASTAATGREREKREKGERA